MPKYLRIAVTALSLTACVLLVALCVRSYWHADSFVLGHAPRRCTVIDSIRGKLYTGFYHGAVRFRISSKPLSSLGHFFDLGNSALVLPHWTLATFTAVLGALPWLRRRFSLRTLLIATTLIAVALAAIVYESR